MNKLFLLCLNEKKKDFKRIIRIIIKTSSKYVKQIRQASTSSKCVDKTSIKRRVSKVRRFRVAVISTGQQPTMCLFFFLFLSLYTDCLYKDHYIQMRCFPKT